MSKNHKAKMGRPLQSPLPRNDSVTIRLNETEMECLQRYCWRYDRSVSDVIRDALMVLSVIPDNPIVQMPDDSKLMG